MARASKTVANPALSALNADTAIIVSTFRNFGVDTVDTAAVDALLRRVSSKETFNAIRVKALAAWLETNRAYDAKLALANVDGTLANPKAFGKGAKRTDAQQKDYKNANDAWGYMLRCGGIETMNKRAPRVPKASKATKAAEVVTAVTKAVQSAQSVVVTRGDVVLQLGLASALMGRVYKENAKSPELKGDKGSLIRDLVAHVAKQMAIIEAMKD